MAVKALSSSGAGGGGLMTSPDTDQFCIYVLLYTPNALTQRGNGPFSDFL